MPRSLRVVAAAAATGGSLIVVALANPAFATTSSGTKACGANYTPFVRATTQGSAVFYGPGDPNPTLFNDANPTSHTVYGVSGGGSWRVTAPSISGMTSGCAPFSR